MIETHLPRVRIENLLGEVDSWCGFIGAFCPLGGYQPRSDNLEVALPAALIAHGTNLGIAAMGHGAEGVTVDMLQHVSRWFLREESLRAVNAVLVDYHNRLDLSSVWGDGTRSSSDGQRFGVRASSLLGVLYPRYFGYYDRAVTVYTHTSDQCSVFGFRAISCSARSGLRARWPARERHDPATAGAFDRYSRLHRACLRPLLHPGLQLHATVAGSGRPAVVQDRPGPVLRAAWNPSSAEGSIPT